MSETFFFIFVMMLLFSIGFSFLAFVVKKSQLQTSEYYRNLKEGTDQDDSDDVDFDMIDEPIPTAFTPDMDYTYDFVDVEQDLEQGEEMEPLMVIESTPSNQSSSKRLHKKSLNQAIVMSEILGKPKGLS